MEAMEELYQLSDAMVQAAALLADEDADEASSRRSSTFLNVVALGNVVSLISREDREDVGKGLRFIAFILFICSEIFFTLVGLALLSFPFRFRRYIYIYIFGISFFCFSR